MMKAISRLFRKVPPDAVGNQDIVILVIGPTGAGKSTFIKLATDGNDVEVGHGLGSCTMKVEGFRCPQPGDKGRNIVFVDTPALNHDTQPVSDIEKSISSWIGALNGTARRAVTGILYMHRITDNRITELESPLVTLRAFERLCGSDFAARTLLVTTMWNNVSPEIGREREKQLEVKYWKTMAANGSKIYRFENTTDSAWAAVDRLLTSLGRI